MLVSVIIIFTAVAVTFILYDVFVQRRNNIVLDAATKSHMILSSLFPSNVRDRLYAERAQEGAANGKGGQSTLKTLLAHDNMGGPTGEADADMGYKGKPIADLFTESTVLFADIAGFTAWSSQREPAQVFTLLETLYRAFDEIAKRRRVFKVETIGDCYVAVTGVPEPQKDHAIIMCRFARDMMTSTRQLTKRLETTLGPDTGDLDMRVGIHSGPVTAGVLRGERSRFQLFGDTMNTASRTESTGLRGKIQLSQETADLLITVGKGHWLSQREDKVVAKGKGEMTTYWLSLKKDNYASSSAGSDSKQSDAEESAQRLASVGSSPKDDPRAKALASEKTTRLIEWNCDVLLRLIKQVCQTRLTLRIRLFFWSWFSHCYLVALRLLPEESQVIAPGKVSRSTRARTRSRASLSLKRCRRLFICPTLISVSRTPMLSPCPSSLPLLINCMTTYPTSLPCTERTTFTTLSMLRM